MHIRRCILELQTRGKDTFTSNIRSRAINHPDRRTDYGHKITNITIEKLPAKGREAGPQANHEGRIPTVFYKHYPAYAAKQMNVSELARVGRLSRQTLHQYLRLIA